MPDLKLQVSPREILGKKVKVLRRRGLTPANIYGHGVQSEAVQVDTAVITQLLRKGGRNAIINLQVAGDKEARPVMVRGVQREPTTGNLLHIDFYQVSLREKMRADVPLVLVGKAPAVAAHGGVLLQGIDSIAVEALPTDFPPQIEIDVSGLAEINDAVHVRDLSIDPKVTLLSDLDLVVAKVSPPRVVVEVEEEVPEEEEVAEGEEAAPAEGAEGGAPEEE